MVVMDLLEIAKEINYLADRCCLGINLKNGKEWKAGCDEIIARYSLSQSDWYRCRVLALKTYGRRI
jgi:hypothetical protein